MPGEEGPEIVKRRYWSPHRSCSHISHPTGLCKPTGLSGGQIAGVVIGLVAGLFILSLLLVYLWAYVRRIFSSRASEVGDIEQNIPPTTSTASNNESEIREVNKAETE